MPFDIIVFFYNNKPNANKKIDMKSVNLRGFLKLQKVDIMIKYVFKR